MWKWRVQYYDAGSKAYVWYECEGEYPNFFDAYQAGTEHASYVNRKNVLGDNFIQCDLEVYRDLSES